ncbi:uncharacterized protein PpBr36_09381 [Pyricularia pennisetigena]|uniref:uncharacterized protein n=1 Tax=Pyricularia pennisetigena TaxID=1578925 RepID=UPI00114E9FC0|nr:uncharacterized protein PpBr36_09381 [Pyricularia pennisetigena]TLS21758.1 hypothetical protein PpBr36_09381 [Pyricularia pennisetigena]
MCDKTWEWHYCKEQCADESTVQIVQCNNINCNYRRFGTFDSEKAWRPSYNKCQKHGYYNPHDRCRAPKWMMNLLTKGFTTSRQKLHPVLRALLGSYSTDVQRCERQRRRVPALSE